MTHSKKSLTAFCGVIAAALILIACGGSVSLGTPGTSPPGGGGSGSGSESSENTTLRVVSNRADLISGGDALIEILADSAPRVTLNGINISAQFGEYQPKRYRALVTGLAVGNNVITDGVSSITIINHPNGGPVFSGPQLAPWKCNNAAAVDDACNQPTEYAFFYKSNDSDNSGFLAYNPESPATDVAETTTDEGVNIPFIVRQETGFQNRDQYKIAVLYKPGQAWTATAPQKQFNGKLLVEHGASCGTAYGSGGAPGVLNERGLSRGFAVMSTALSNSGHNCNIALQAESIVMAKERVIEQYGDLRYTIGEGCSGGALAIQWMANAYPGLYQGILPTCSFPDAWSTATQFLDYHLTIDYFFDPSQWAPGVLWEPNQMAAVQGHITVVNSQVSNLAQFSVAVPTEGCNNAADGKTYHPVDNPDGVRCAIQDAAINILGPRPLEIWSPAEITVQRGFAGFPVDNIGVQYGLKTLQSGIITPLQFVDLNVKLGGLDADAKIIDQRLAAVEPALANAYRSGLINETNNLNKTAIIDCRGPDPGLFHDAYRTYSIRARLDREHGGHGNHLIWDGPFPLTADSACAGDSFVAMDRWLAAIEKDNSNTTLAEKVVSAKPSDLTDVCYNGNGQQVLATTCGTAAVTVYGTPRTVAGDQITTDKNKCQLVPLMRGVNYGLVPFLDTEWAKLVAVFPDGVCDFSKPGVSQQGTVPWMIYQNADGAVIYGGVAMPAAPANSGSGWGSAAFDVFR